MNLENNTSVLPPESAVGMPKDRRREALGNLCVLPDEILCEILISLAPIDVARFSCVSSVMYILCNEEPLWMSLCLRNVTRPVEYKGSWKKTTLHQLDFPSEYYEGSKKLLHFDGFNSLFLYRRLYRCYTSLSGFSFDSGTVERKENIDVEEFQREYDGRKPVLISGLADNWQARKSWTTEQLLVKYGDTKFRLSQRSSRKITMKFKEYLSYMQMQHDEDPLYIFDEKFGDAAPDLLKDYTVPYLFQEDYFDILDSEKRPPFRWLIIGPERSGASWHVDPALTSAWNTLICGRKRWALYPPGRVPLGVTVHVNEEDGDVNVDGPSSLQWWLDFYPLLPDAEKPIEFTQLPGETIFVPSGWWHCVLNLETTIAVTQNFVNSKNFEFVCLDMAPGYRHKGVCRAGVLALDEGIVDYVKKNGLCFDDNLNSEPTRKEKRLRICHPSGDSKNENDANGWSKSNGLDSLDFSYDINFLSMFLDKERDQYNSLWGPGNCIGQREMREWLWKLWLGRPGNRDLIWKGSCLALNVGKWFERVVEICSFHGFPSPLHDEKLPVGTGSNPVYLVADYAIKIFAEGGLEASLYGLGSELEFYNLLDKMDSPLKNYIPGVLASGILLLENGSYTVLPWDGKGIPAVIANCNFISMDHNIIDYPFGIWSKKLFECRNAGMSQHESGNSGGCALIWPYIVTKRCKGKMFAELRDALQWEDALNLASFLGEQLHNLHLVPCPYPNISLLTVGERIELPHDKKFSEIATYKVHMTAEGSLFISTLNKKRKDLSDRLSKWGDPIPHKLIEKVAEYIPHDFAEFLNIFENEKEVSKSCTWVHSDVMDDNIYMTQCSSDSLSRGSTYPLPAEDGHMNSYGSNDGQKYSWHPSYVLDFSNLSIGDPMLDLIPIHLDIFRGDSRLLKQFLKSYGLQLGRKESPNKLVNDDKLQRLSYRAMCYCILHDENILGAIFSLWKELRMANSWEEVEEIVWGDLNTYAAGFR